MDHALSDITVLDLGQVIAMPFCTMLLADLGARVIKVESRERGRERVSLGIKRRRHGVEERVPAAQYRERNKLGITLELKTPMGLELFKELVRHADVVTENFSVGTMERLGLAYEDLRRVKPDIIYASITAFGQDGPYATQRGYDILAQAISGYMSITGSPEQPPTRSGQSISDYYAGMLCAFSIVSAVHYRRDQIAAIIQGGPSQRPKTEVVRTLASAGVPAAPVNNVAEMVADPQVRARQMFVELDHPTYGPVKTTGTPLKLSETPGRVRWLAPLPGEHNEEVFVGLLGHSKDDLARWLAEGVI